LLGLRDAVERRWMGFPWEAALLTFRGELLLLLLEMMLSAFFFSYSCRALILLNFYFWAFSREGTGRQGSSETGEDFREETVSLLASNEKP
jgi:hypothetical protein